MEGKDEYIEAESLRFASIVLAAAVQENLLFPVLNLFDMQAALVLVTTLSRIDPMPKASFKKQTLDAIPALWPRSHDSKAELLWLPLLFVVVQRYCLEIASSESHPWPHLGPASRHGWHAIKTVQRDSTFVQQKSLVTIKTFGVVDWFRVVAVVRC
jgi:hypothetical protein